MTLSGKTDYGTDSASTGALDATHGIIVLLRHVMIVEQNDKQRDNPFVLLDATRVN